MLSITILLLSSLLHGAQAAPLHARSNGLARRASGPALNLRRLHLRQFEEDIAGDENAFLENNIVSNVNGGNVAINAETGAGGSSVDIAVDPAGNLATGAAAEVGDATAVDALPVDPNAGDLAGETAVAANDDVAGGAGDGSLAGGAGDDVLSLVSASGPRTSVNTATITLVKSFEGFEPSPADDGVGFPTVGFGHKCIQTGCAEVPFTIPMTRADADALLLTDMQEGIDCVNANVNVDLNDNQFGALASFAFNAGCGSLTSSTLLRRLNAGEDPDTVAAAELPKFNKATDQRTKKKITLAGLTRRRAAEVVLFQTAP